MLARVVEGRIRVPLTFRKALGIVGCKWLTWLIGNLVQALGYLRIKENGM